MHMLSAEKRESADAPSRALARIDAEAHGRKVTAPKHVLAPSCATEHSADQVHLSEAVDQAVAAAQNGPTPVEQNWYLLKK